MKYSRKASWLCIVFIFLSCNLFAQFDASDSSVSIVSYWNVQDKKTYSVKQENYFITKGDTGFIEQIKYELDIYISNATKKKYTISWHYGPYQTNSEDKLTIELIKGLQNTEVIFNASEMGVFKEIINWKQIQAKMESHLNSLKTLFKDEKFTLERIKKIEENYSTQGLIETVVFKDIVDYYSFHGGRYIKNDERNLQKLYPNQFGGKPFDSKCTYKLIRINFTSHTADLQFWETADRVQTEYNVHKHEKKMQENADKRKNMAETLIQDRMNSTINYETGWINSMRLYHEFTADKVTAIESRIFREKK